MAFPVGINHAATVRYSSAIIDEVDAKYHNTLTSITQLVPTVGE